MADKPKTEVHTDNGLPPSVLSDRVSHSSSGDRRVPWFRESSMVWIWQHDEMTDDYKIIKNYVNTQNNGIIRYHEGLKKNLDDPVPNGNLLALHCLSNE
jgi:hypothetical protein